MYEEFITKFLEEVEEVRKNDKYLMKRIEKIGETEQEKYIATFLTSFLMAILIKYRTNSTLMLGMSKILKESSKACEQLGMLSSLE